MRAIILSLEAALALATLLTAVGLAGTAPENPFHKNAAFALANDALQNAAYESSVFDGTAYCAAREPCDANCVKATRTVFNGGSFKDEDLFVCWGQ